MLTRPFLVSIKRLMPKKRRSAHDVYYVFFALSALSSLLPLSWLLFAIDKNVTAYSALVGAAGVVLSLLLWFYKLPRIWAQAVYQSTLMWLILFNAAQQGGVTSPSMVWLSIVPLLPMFSFDSRRVVSFWLGVSFVSVLGMLALQFLDVIPSRPGETPSDLMYGALTYTLLCYAEWSLIDAVDSMNVTTLRQVNRNNLSLKRLSQDLRQANAHKDQFLAIVSHEMRTPLNAVMGYLSLMSTDPKIEQESKEFVTGAQNSAAHLLTVINDLLDYSQIQNGKVAMNPQIINLHTMLQTTHSTLSPRAIDLGLTYRVDIAPNVPEWVCADQHRLTQVLINLLGNALKFTDSGYVDMRVTYSPTPDQPRSGKLWVHVEDTGPGIPLEAQKRIFEPFVQLKRADKGRSSNDALRGNGLGLSISDTLIKSHGGELIVESTPGKGSTFSFQIPVRVVTPPQQSAPIQEHIHTTPAKLLIVDDHAVNRVVAKATIQRAMPNACIEEAENGTTGLAKMSQTRYDLVLLDLVMPDIDGIEVMRRVRKTLDAPYKDVHVIALTANVAGDALEACKEVGIDEVMAKPFDRCSLINRVLFYCGQTQPAQAS